MAKLSGKQQANIEQMWELEKAKDANLLAISNKILDLAEERKRIVAAIDAIVAQVPESVEDTWYGVDMSHYRLESAGVRLYRTRAYALIEGILKA